METKPIESRHMSRFTLTDNLVVSLDGSLVDYQETRFRVLSHRFMCTLKPLASSLSKDLGVGLSSIASLSLESDSSLDSNTYCVFDFLDLSSRKRKGIIRASWVPLAVFHNRDRVLSIHASYNEKGPSLSSVCLVSASGEEVKSSCTSTTSALKVSRSHLSRRFPSLYY